MLEFEGYVAFNTGLTVEGLTQTHRPRGREERKRRQGRSLGRLICSQWQRREISSANHFANGLIDVAPEQISTALLTSKNKDC